MTRQIQSLLIVSIIVWIGTLNAGLVYGEPLKVCTTLPSLGNIAEQVGGEHAAVTVFSRGHEDPHLVQARPSFIRSMSTADVYIQNGMELEIGWAPVLIRQSRNARIAMGRPGYVDASTVITPKDVLTGLDRSYGDVHPGGNPHYLLAPTNGIRVAKLIRDRFVQIRPDLKSQFDANYNRFRDQIATRLVGPELAKRYDALKLAVLHEHGKLEAFLEKTNQRELLGGWIGQLSKLANNQIVVDHNQWVYFTDAFQLEVVGILEPKPGMSPTTRHLAKLIATMDEKQVKAIGSVPYFAQKYAKFVSSKSGATIVPLAHEVAAQPSTDDYIAMIDHNVNQLARVLR